MNVPEPAGYYHSNRPPEDQRYIENLMRDRRALKLLADGCVKVWSEDEAVWTDDNQIDWYAQHVASKNIVGPFSDLAEAILIAWAAYERVEA